MLITCCWKKIKKELFCTIKENLYEYNKTFKIDQPSDSIKYKELTPDVGTTIYNNLKNNKAYQELISDLGYDFGDLIEGYTSDTSLNYDSDYDLDYNY